MNFEKILDFKRGNSHAPRGNSYKDAPASRDAERRKMHSHAGAMGTIVNLVLTGSIH